MLSRKAQASVVQPGRAVLRVEVEHHPLALVVGKTVPLAVLVLELERWRHAAGRRRSPQMPEARAPAGRRTASRGGSGRCASCGSPVRADPGSAHDILAPGQHPVSEGARLPVSTSETNYLFFENREALVLAGGGARAAYQVGVLGAIADWLPADAACPFEVLVGTSAGALNAATLVSRAASFREGVDVLEKVWAGFHLEQVVRADPATTLRGGLHWILSMVSGGWLLSPPRSLLDTSPLRELLLRTIPMDGIRASVEAGLVRALVVATTSYSTGQAVAFFDGAPEVEEWSRVRRAGVRRRIDIDVLMASSAIPFIFPAGKVDCRLLRRRRHAPARAAQPRGAHGRQPPAGRRHARGSRGVTRGRVRRPAAQPREPARLRARLAVHRRLVHRPRALEADQRHPAVGRGGYGSAPQADRGARDRAQRRPDGARASAPAAQCLAACARCSGRSVRSRRVAGCSRATCCSSLHTPRN